MLQSQPLRQAADRYEQLRQTNSVKQSQFMAELEEKTEVKQYRNCE